MFDNWWLYGPHSTARRTRFGCALACAALTTAIGNAADPAVEFHSSIQPILENYCYDCHGYGMSKGKVSLEEFASDAAMLAQDDLWFAVLKNVRAGIMPPDDKPRPTSEEVEQLANWIKYGAFGLDPADPDPGRVTIRRLNRIEYGNTIRDLMGVEFRGDVEFPPDDTGHGFDNIGDVLSVSPLLLEKYLQAADTIVQAAVPKVSHIVQERVATPQDLGQRNPDTRYVALSYKEAASVSHVFSVAAPATYQLKVEFEVKGPFDFDPTRAALTVRVDGSEIARDEYVWHETKRYDLSFDLPLLPGEHTVTLESTPLAELTDETTTGALAEAPGAAAPALPDAEPPAVAQGPGQISPGNAASSAAPSPATPPPPRVGNSNQFRVSAVRLMGPFEREHWVQPANYTRFFPQGPAPASPLERDRYARACLERFTTRAFRRPADPGLVDRLVALARETYTQPGQTFETGMARAFMVALASPRFVFRVEAPARGSDTSAEVAHLPVDEYALASRLSYFLWSTMPDEELFELAGRGRLRSELAAQVERMIADPRGQQFVRNFTGQWLQARDVDHVSINMRAVLNVTQRRTPGGQRVEFDSEIRTAMRRETEMLFDRIMQENRSVLELIDSDYTYLNERLARHYGIPDVTGREMRLVQLPPDGPRGGVLTQGTVLTVTSNPTRTSPVKRGQFILENILGTPAPPPPATVPDLEESKKAFTDREPTLRETLEQHRSDPLCSSCHARMDPLGFALENFNALGMWRDTDGTAAIDTTGQLVTGEAFADIRDVKRIITNERRLDYYRCLTEKLLTYALGRGLEYHDVVVVDDIVERLERSGGQFSVLLHGVIASAPFQKTRVRPDAAQSALAAASEQIPSNP